MSIKSSDPCGIESLGNLMEDVETVTDFAQAPKGLQSQQAIYDARLIERYKQERTTQKIQRAQT